MSERENLNKGHDQCAGESKVVGQRLKHEHVHPLSLGTSSVLVSVPVDVGSGTNFFDDKDYLAVALDGSGQPHFYITWTFFSHAPQSPNMLTDSMNGVYWRTTTISG